MSEPETPFFSVVIASYNYGHLLPRAVASALNQQYDGAFEVIVVDDGSTDDTPEIIKPWQDRVRYHRQKNAGHCAANNTGARLARGQWLCFLDADDALRPNALADFARAIAGQPDNVAVISGGYVSVDEAGNERKRPGDTLSGLSRETLFARHVRKQLVGFKHGCTVLHRRVLETLSYPEGLKNSTDIVFMGRALANFDAAAFADEVVDIHAHPQRVRRNARVIVSAGLQPVDILFDPAVMPPAMMCYRREFLQRRLLSLFGVCYRAGQYGQALSIWWHAVCRGLAGPWRLRYLKRALGALLRLPFQAKEAR
jgi:glycosyltransferase involved in cell wall biosynthesis